jgi:hypothetical protein
MPPPPRALQHVAEHLFVCLVTPILKVLLETVGLIGKQTHRMWGPVYVFMWNY